MTSLFPYSHLDSIIDSIVSIANCDLLVNRYKIRLCKSEDLMLHFNTFTNVSKMGNKYFTLSMVLLLVSQSFSWSPLSLYCYRCVSTQPGCGTPFNWLWYWGEVCPEEDDKCVKVIERKGAETVITRECLSSLRAVRTDIPADHYEGCRPAAKDERLAHYVNNTIKELDIRRDHYDETTWCFCNFDNRCNTGTSSAVVSLTLIASVITLLSFNYII